MSFIVLALASIMSIRMLGLFMILPVFSAYASQLPGANATHIGIALGVYGLTQALLQIPMGMLSDRFGRKPIIAWGLCLLIIGSLIAAVSDNMTMLILGRALQGAGAIGSTVLALLADSTDEKSRGKAMAFIGLSIGCSFMIAMVLGPMINHWFHLSGIFLATACLATFGIILLATVPTPPKTKQTDEKNFLAILTNKQLLSLDAGILLLHAILTALFVAIPILLTHQLQLSEPHQIKLYLCVLIVSFSLALPFIVVAEKKQKMRSVFLGAIAVIAISQVGLFYCHQHIAALTALLLLFFTAFTLLEALLPSLVSKSAPSKNKGAAMGIYSSSQFLGIFIGGTTGGWIFSHTHITGIFILCALFAFIWFCIAFSSKKYELRNAMGAGNLAEIQSS